MPLPKNLPTNYHGKEANQNQLLLANRYHVDKKLGAGNFGTAFLIFDDFVKPPEDNKKVLKQICVGSLDPGESVDAMHEAKLLSQLKQKNIVQFHDSFLDGQFFCIVTEYCEGGDLDVRLQECKKLNTFIEEGQVIKWLRQLLKALSYMHEKRILHRDLKTKNIFLKDNKIKIGDFGISRILMGTSDMASTFVGTPYYMSPEVLKHEQYDEKCDIWSLGCVLYEICCLKHAFEGQSLMAVMYKIVSDQTPELPDRYSRGLSNIMEGMLARDPDVRKTAKEILKRLSIIDSHSVHPNKEKAETLTPKERLRLRKQRDADERFKKHKELATQNYKENERRHKESYERNFQHTSIESSPKFTDEHGNFEEYPDNPKVPSSPIGKTVDIEEDPFDLPTVIANSDAEKPRNHKQSKTISAPSRGGDFKGLPKAAATVPPKSAQQLEENDDSNDGTLQGTSVDISFDGESTADLISSLIRNGDIPEDAELAETFYSQHEDFESDSDHSFEMSLTDMEYRDMIGCLEDALYLEETSRTVVSKTKSSKVSNVDAVAKKVTNTTSTFTNNVIDGQIRNMRDECLKKLGEETFNRAYNYLRNIWPNHVMPEASSYASVIKNLAEIVPDKNKCFLLEQLIYLENEKERQKFS